MTTAIIEQPRHAEPRRRTRPPPAPVVALKRRTIDAVLIGFGVVATAVVRGRRRPAHLGPQLRQRLRRRRAVVAEHHLPDRRGAHRRRSHRPASSSPDQRLDTGNEAEAYASFINGHLARHRRRSDLRRPRRRRERSQGRRHSGRRRRPAAGQDRRAAGHGRRHHRPAQHPVQGRDPARPAAVGLRLVDGRHDRRNRRHRRLRRRRRSWPSSSDSEWSTTAGPPRPPDSAERTTNGARPQGRAPSRPGSHAGVRARSCGEQEEDG